MTIEYHHVDGTKICKEDSFQKVGERQGGWFENWHYKPESLKRVQDESVPAFVDHLTTPTFFITSSGETYTTLSSTTVEFLEEKYGVSLANIQAVTEKEIKLGPGQKLNLP